jgi:hypothetical protein
MNNEHDSAANARRARGHTAKPGAYTRPSLEVKDTEALGESFEVVGGSRSGKVRGVNAGDLPEQDAKGKTDAPAEVRAAVVAQASREEHMRKDLTLGTKPVNPGGAKCGRKANASSEGDSEATSPRVPRGADKQGEEDLWQRYGAKRGIWSEKMLVALERGIKGNLWFSLIDKIGRADTLELAWAKVSSNAGACGVDGITVERFAKDSQSRLLAVKEQIMQGSYQPKPVKRVWIPKPGSSEKQAVGNTNSHRPGGAKRIKDGHRADL